MGSEMCIRDMYIIFANTDAYTDEIDKRIPFRNNILHNGIVMYSDEDIDVAYELLLGLIEILITQTSHIKNGICSLKNQYFSSQNSAQAAAEPHSNAFCMYFGSR